MLKMSSLGRILGIARDQRGVSAIEFALLAPLMVGLYLGCVEISDGVSAERKVSMTAAALANLSAQVTTISTTDMNNMFDAATAIMSPFSASNLKITLTCLKMDSTGKATVAWSETRNGTAYAVGAAYTFDSNSAPLAVPSSWLLLGEASYAYTPTIGYTITGTLTLSDKMFMSPRISPPSYGTTSCS